MRLSEAILLGRHTIKEPKEAQISNCAIPMALNSAGRTLLGCSISGNTPEIELCEGNDYHQLVTEWPWLKSVSIHCPWCGICPMELTGSLIVWHPFDWHVMEAAKITLEQMCDWIRSIEPEEPEYIPDYRDEQGTDEPAELAVYRDQVR